MANLFGNSRVGTTQQFARVGAVMLFSWVVIFFSRSWWARSNFGSDTLEESGATISDDRESIRHETWDWPKSKDCPECIQPSEDRVVAWNMHKSGPMSSHRHTRPKNTLPPTKLLRHAPGFTMFEYVYMSNGTLFVVTDDQQSAWPEVRMMTSTGGWAVNSPENIAEREPTDTDMSFVSPAEAKDRWTHRVMPIDGTTFLVNDPGQFLNHYYHFVAETFFGMWRMYSSFDPAISALGETTLEEPTRLVFPHCPEKGWRDYSTFNQFFLHGVFPSLSIESETMWVGRGNLTKPGTGRVFKFERLLLADRSASFRGIITGTINARIAAEAFDATKDTSSRWWWEPVRRAVLQLARVNEQTLGLVPQWANQWTSTGDMGDDLTPQQRQVAQSAGSRMPIVITYVVRAPPKRSMRPEDHLGLVDSLTDLCTRRNWELNIMHAERLSKEEQIQIASRTTVMLGVHGNGLTHLVWMPLTPLSTVIEIFYPGGFAEDYAWTSGALGLRHYAMWNDTYYAHPHQPRMDYPEGFHGDRIPAHGPSIAKLIEERMDGKHP